MTLKARRYPSATYAYASEIASDSDDHMGRFDAFGTSAPLAAIQPTLGMSPVPATVGPGVGKMPCANRSVSRWRYANANVSHWTHRQKSAGQPKFRCPTVDVSERT